MHVAAYLAATWIISTNLISVETRTYKLHVHSLQSNVIISVTNNNNRGKQSMLLQNSPIDLNRAYL